VHPADAECEPDEQRQNLACAFGFPTILYLSRKILKRFKKNLEVSVSRSFYSRGLPTRKSFTYLGDHHNSVNGGSRAVYGRVR
jgi:hypothetical protein